jgi:HlyD family secretion protein
LPVKRGISDEDYTEIEEGWSEGQEVVSGGYKAISKELEDGKKISVGRRRRMMKTISREGVRDGGSRMV